VGQSFGNLLEVSLQNKAGEFLTSAESDVSAAAEEVSIAQNGSKKQTTSLTRCLSRQSCKAFGPNLNPNPSLEDTFKHQASALSISQ